MWLLVWSTLSGQLDWKMLQICSLFTIHKVNVLVWLIIKFFLLLSISFYFLIRSTILQQQFNRVGRVEHGSVALPGIIRSGSIGGPDTFNMGTMPSAQQQITTGQMHRGHMPPLVSKRWQTCWSVFSFLFCFDSDTNWNCSFQPVGHLGKNVRPKEIWSRKFHNLGIRLLLLGHLQTLCLCCLLLSESSPAGPDGDHQQQYAGCAAGPGWPGTCR